MIEKIVISILLAFALYLTQVIITQTASGIINKHDVDMTWPIAVSSLIYASIFSWLAV